MRASLFLSALFVASLVGGTAAAERPEKDENRPRATRTREVNPLERSSRQTVDRSEKNDKVEKAEPGHRQQRKESAARQASQLSKAELAAKLPKQAMERMRCEGSEDCSSGHHAKKSSQTNADRGTKHAAAPSQVNERGKASAPSAAERELMQKMLTAKCSNKARGGCGSDQDF